MYKICCITGSYLWVIHRVGVDYKNPITITVPIKLSITITVVIEKAITITIIRLRLQLLVYHGNDSRLFIRHTLTVLSCMIERATVLRCENVNNQTFILHPGLSINREIRVFPRAVENTGKYREIGNPCPHNFIKHCYLYLTWNYLQQ